MLFTPVDRVSNSIPKSLIEFSKEKSIDTKLLDFDLISHTTLMKENEDSKYDNIDIEEITQADIENPNIYFLQKYNIRIFPFFQKDEDVKLSLSTNKSKTKVFVTIKEGSFFTKSNSLHKDLIDSIWKKKLKAGFFIDIFEDTLDAQIQKLLKIVPYDKALSKDLKFTVALGMVPIGAIDAKLEKLYKEKQRKSNSILFAIEKETLIARYLLPKNSTNGRSCNGKFLLPQEPKNDIQQPITDETIKVIKSEDYIEYFSNISGYPLLSNNNLSISKTLTLEGASFKTTANIDAGDNDNDILVHVKHSKTNSEDAIGSGVKIDVKKLDVDGSIASNVNISTQELNIDAQTHRNSTIEVKNTASIKLHRGDLTATDANIDILENGKVTASKSVSVKQMLGGTIIAPVVKVDEILSNVTIIASELIDIKNILGENNKLIINPDAVKDHHDEIELLKEKRKKIIDELEKKQLEHEKKVKEHSLKIDRIKTFQKRVLKAQADGKKPMKQDILRVKQFKKDSQNLSLEKETLEEEALHINTLDLELDKLLNKDLYAKIKLESSYNGHTKVFFIDAKTEEEIVYTPEGKIGTISLALDKKNKKIISTD